MSALQQLGIDRMSVEERLELIGEIWDSITEDGAEFVMPEWHRAELKKRIAAADADPNGGIPWEEVLAKLEKKR